MLILPADIAWRSPADDDDGLAYLLQGLDGAQLGAKRSHLGCLGADVFDIHVYLVKNGVEYLVLMMRARVTVFTTQHLPNDGAIRLKVDVNRRRWCWVGGPSLDPVSLTRLGLWPVELGKLGLGPGLELHLLSQSHVRGSDIGLCGRRYLA